jgi:hypothetical protein
MIKPKQKPKLKARSKKDHAADKDYLHAIGRAISSNDRRTVIDELLKAWEKVPELRFGQFIVNVMTSDYRKMDSFFSVEDMDLVDAAKEFLKKRNNK